MAAIGRFTSGNFGLVQHLFSDVQRIMEVNGLARIAEDVVQTARESLLIGPT
jgi:hypothetical protein